MTDFVVCDKGLFKGAVYIMFDVRSEEKLSVILLFSRNKLAVVDENSTCLVYNLSNNELLFQVQCTLCFPIVYILLITCPVLVV